MDEQTSPYYPPRAGWSRHFYEAVYALRGQLQREDLKLPHFAITVSFRQFLLCLFVPGFSFTFAGWKWLGRGTLLAWFAALGVFMAWLGYAAANIAFGLLMSMHVSSIIHFLNRISPSRTVLRRLALSLGVLFVVWQMIYGMGLRLVEKHLFMPLRWNEKVYVVNPGPGRDAFQRGDLVAVHTKRTGANGVQIRAGFTLDKVLAQPGDIVRFSRNRFQVNEEVAELREPWMPTAGSLKLDEKTWLIWPTLTTVARYNVGEDAIQAAVLQMAQVHREQMIGRPYRRWFWRDQTQ
jgi:hypothetical protein